MLYSREANPKPGVPSKKENDKQKNSKHDGNRGQRRNNDDLFDNNPRQKGRSFLTD